MEKEIEVTWKQASVKVTLSPITWGMYKRIRRKSVIVKDFNGKPMQFRDMDMYEELLTLFSIKDAPFDKTEECLDMLTISDGIKLRKAALEVNQDVPHA